MTNAEKYLKGGVDIKEFVNNFVKYRIYNKGIFSASTLFEFLQAEVKPTLTEDERVILRNICFTPLKDFYIERKHGTLKLHNRVDELYDFFAYDHLFQFIKERRRILYYKIVRR